jgi:hypothetical protein
MNDYRPQILMMQLPSMRWYSLPALWTKDQLLKTHSETNDMKLRVQDTPAKFQYPPATSIQTMEHPTLSGPQPLLEAGW